MELDITSINRWIVRKLKLIFEPYSREGAGEVKERAQRYTSVELDIGTSENLFYYGCHGRKINYSH
jgi:hypothetical protein